MGSPVAAISSGMTGARYQPFGLSGHRRVYQPVARDTFSSAAWASPFSAPHPIRFGDRTQRPVLEPSSPRLDVLRKVFIFEPKKKLQYTILPELKDLPIEHVTFSSTDGVTLHAWYIPAKPGKHTIVFSHGNKGALDRDYRQRIIKALAEDGYGVLAYDPRGYGMSTGKPTMKGVFEDVASASKYLALRKNIPVCEQFIVGESLGGSITLHAAATSPVPYRAVFVFSTFTSIPELVKAQKEKLIPFLDHVPIEKLYNRRLSFNSIEMIPKIKSPVLIAHLSQDDLIPYEMSDRLFQNATGAPYKRHLRIEGEEHTGMFDIDPKQVLAAMNKMLKETESWHQRSKAQYALRTTA